jgi:hypothetical protein
LTGGRRRRNKKDKDGSSKAAIVLYKQEPVGFREKPTGLGFN